MWMDEDTAVAGQPVGFAEPLANPLGAYASAILIAPPDTPPVAPQTYTAASDPGPALDQIAPAPPETRDPNQPFDSGQGDQMPGQVDRDPREPIVTASFSGKGPDFAPPTGEPVAAKWAPPTGQPVTTLPPLSGPPMASAWLPPSPQSAPWGRPISQTPPQSAPWGPPSPSQPPIASWGRPNTNPTPVLKPGVGYAPPVPAPEASFRARYASAPDALGKLSLVLQAVPWPVLLILLAGVILGNGWSVFIFCLAWIVCGSNAQVARAVMNRCFLIGAGVYMVVWVASTALEAYAILNAYYLLVRLCCAALIIALPLVAWRSLERGR